MAESLPRVCLVRHGQTEWSLSGQHTGLTDIPLTPAGEEQARQVSGRLRGMSFAHVWTSPLQRAHRTCELAGFGKNAQVDPDLVEWNYGDFEGLKRADIERLRPGWQLFRDGCPGGESVADITRRADRFIAKVRAASGDAVVFSSGHILRVIAARWCGWEIAAGAHLYLATATLSVLGYEHTQSEPVIRLWNESGQVA